MVLSVRVGVPGGFVTWIHRLIPPDMLMFGGSGVLCHLDSLTATLYLMGSINSHLDILVCDGDQQQATGPSFSKYGGLKLCRSASNVPTSRSPE